MTSDIISEVALFPQCAGSSSLQQGVHHCLVSIYGPSTVTKVHKELVDKAAILVEVRPAVGPACTKEAVVVRQLTSLLESIVRCKDHPRTQILVQVQLVSRGDPATQSSALCTAINAVSLALLDAQLPLYCTPVAMTSCEGRVTVVRNALDQSIIGVHYHATENDDSPLSLDKLKAGLDSIRTQEFQDLLDVFKRTLVDKFLTTM